MTSTNNSHRLVSWNAVSLKIPSSWQTIVSGSHNLIFEKDFEAILEIRWQSASAKDFQVLTEKTIRQWLKISDKKLHKTPLTESHKTLFKKFSAVRFCDNKGSTSFIFLFDSACSLFLMLQIYPQKNTKDPLNEIKEVQCSKGDTSTSLWAIQDFCISIPHSFAYSGHSLQAGMTSLHFSRKNANLHICRLAPASVRLKKSTPVEILSSLSGIDEIQLQAVSMENEIYYERSPSITRQILLRLQRKKPFILAVLLHKPDNDRLLAAIVESTHPIDHHEFNVIFKSYEIVSEKKSC